MKKIYRSGLLYRGKSSSKNLDLDPLVKAKLKIEISKIKRARLNILGVTADGILITEPKLKPRTFTIRRLRNAVRVVKNERMKQAS